MDKDYWRGFAYFCGLMFCFSMFFTTPDGITLFHGILGLFGIPPAIPFGHGGEIVLFMLIPIVAGIFCFKKIRVYWKNFRDRFNLRGHLLALFVGGAV